MNLSHFLAIVRMRWQTMRNQLRKSGQANWIITIGMLILPKLLGLLLALGNRQQRADFGGGWRLTAGVILEQFLSTLLAPIHMLFHTQFVLGTWLYVNGEATVGDGRVFFTAGKDLDRYVVWDYLCHRRSVVG